MEDGVEQFVKEAVSQRCLAPLGVEGAKIVDDAAFGTRHFDRLHRAKGFGDEAGDHAAAPSQDATIPFDAAGGAVCDEDKGQHGQKGEQGNLRGDAEHDGKGNDGKNGVADDIVDPKAKQGDFPNVPPKAADRFTRRFGQGAGAGLAQDVAEHVFVQQGVAVEHKRPIHANHPPAASHARNGRYCQQRQQ